MSSSSDRPQSPGGLAPPEAPQRRFESGLWRRQREAALAERASAAAAAAARHVLAEGGGGSSDSEEQESEAPVGEEGERVRSEPREAQPPLVLSPLPDPRLHDYACTRWRAIHRAWLHVPPGLTEQRLRDAQDGDVVPVPPGTLWIRTTTELEYTVYLSADGDDTRSFVRSRIADEAAEQVWSEEPPSTANSWSRTRGYPTLFAVPHVRPPWNAEVNWLGRQFPRNRRSPEADLLERAEQRPAEGYRLSTRPGFVRFEEVVAPDDAQQDVDAPSPDRSARPTVTPSQRPVAEPTAQFPTPRDARPSEAPAGVLARRSRRPSERR